LSNRGHGIAPNSLSALRHCLQAGARFVEVDIMPLADRDFALLHDMGDDFDWIAFLQA
jgi:glycerophosphoryl diester phosphodiesterase